MIFDDILIGDEGLIISNAPKKTKSGLCKPQDVSSASSLIRKIFDYAEKRDLIITEKLKTKFFTELWINWELFFNLRRVDYINLVGILPEIVLLSGLIPPENLHTQHFQAFKRLYKGISLWVEHLTDYDDLTPKPSEEWKGYLTEAYLSKSRWDLAKAVLIFDESSQDGLNDFFCPSGHFWFWIELGNCLQLMKTQGLIQPLSLEEIPTKLIAIERLGEHITLLKSGNTNILQKAGSLKCLISNFHRLVEGKCLKGEYSEIPDVKNDPFQDYISKKRFYKNQANRKSEYIVATSYLLSEEQGIQLYKGEKHTPRPKRTKRREAKSKFVKQY